jgi:hypothetical protein
VGSRREPPTLAHRWSDLSDEHRVQRRSSGIQASSHHSACGARCANGDGLAMAWPAAHEPSECDRARVRDIPRARSRRSILQVSHNRPS